MISNTNQPNTGEATSGATGLTTLSPKFIADLKEVFAKHNWPGHPVGFVARPVAVRQADDDVDEDEAGDGDDGRCDPGPDICPDGSIPQQVWVHCPDGTAILRNICP